MNHQTANDHKSTRQLPGTRRYSWTQFSSLTTETMTHSHTLTDRLNSRERERERHRHTERQHSLLTACQLATVSLIITDFYCTCNLSPPLSRCGRFLMKWWSKFSFHTLVWHTLSRCVAMCKKTRANSVIYSPLHPASCAHMEHSVFFSLSLTLTLWLMMKDSSES